MRIFGDLKYLARLFIVRLFICPVREFIWKRKHSPFLYTSINNLKFYLSPGELIDRKIYVHGIFDRRFVEFIASNFKNLRTMLDIGANIGNHSISLSGHFKEVHSFEPNPIVLDRLRKNIEINNIKNITVHPYGAGYEDGEYPFFIDESGNLGASHIVQEAQRELPQPTRKNRKIPFIHVVNLDEYLSTKKIGAIDFVKIDVEGFELDVIKGMENTIKKYRPIVSFEYHGGDFDEEYFQYFSSILSGYELFELVFGNRKDSLFNKIKLFIAYSGKPALMPIKAIEARTYHNIIAIPQNRA